MKTTSAVLAASALAGTAYAQASASSVVQNGLGYLTGGCIATVLSLTESSSPLSQCLDGQLLASIVGGNSSIIAPVGNYLDSFCSSQPCSNETLTNATQTLLSGCATDFTKFGLTNQTVEWAVAQYPLARDVLCLKTSDPFTGNGTSSANTTTLTNSTSSSNSSSNGTFCATSLLTEFESYLGEPLTPTNIVTIALGGNNTAVDAIKSIPPTALCDECIFGGLSLIEEQYPQLGQIRIGGDITGNITVNSFLERTCNATGSGNFTISSNGTLPTNVTESAVNSTLSSVNGTKPQTNLTSLPTQFFPSATAAISSLKASATKLTGPGASDLASSASSLVARAAVTDVKKRWIGQQ
ncbi:hypothetical protein I302_107431 [Kwoniella bestiolae CBS 10118]|uniref:Uncharacterized protein n=1 Tax=Kwoniella bestiolae CBS 10118 TaxID=1296100 RepID=A0A1B9FYK1_9TREE|nr:hypothetical protein I302_06828 [Kwoniella bestiolae CBS 10118]OCF23844.1 hypothetical protein I302_06828 [Kwoniella bestiolae CBS 10118]